MEAMKQKTGCGLRFLKNREELGSLSKEEILVELKRQGVGEVRGSRLNLLRLLVEKLKEKEKELGRQGTL